ncbi:hypothetical protein PCASD_06367 [Puccinia coronata f. sp. avenae]|uniref:CxC1-like cysteine cluster associated with KDZ transposases domain-containing protein n=1 Tax=Puccinia coronata f. sp. avenae TaxID=200324 RepID=A0A2N5UXB1_9BASI|nr:hypothetical protein PCASD_06367 [Puccinia coronata f. sp. avenae]
MRSLTSAQRRVQCNFCRCTPDTVRLLQIGFLPASPIAPQTAFSLPLLIFHDSLWNNCHVGALPFTTTLKEWLEPRSERLFVRRKKHARELQKPFSAAVDLYRSLKNQTNELICQVLQLGPQDILALHSCPACFGPRPSNFNDYPQTTSNQLIICLDGNFQHRHHVKASRDYRPLQTPCIFLKPKEFTQAANWIRAKEIELSPPSKVDRCADSHKAADDKRNESTWKGCDDTGLMGCCCRHDAAIYMGNIYKSGKQRCLPVAILSKLISNCEPKRPIIVLYDIGCALNKYMNARELLHKHWGRLKFGTSVFHAYVYNWLCQLDYNPRFNIGWGLSDGEHIVWHTTTAKVSGHYKFNSAILRHQDASAVLSGLAQKRNCHLTSGVNYEQSFFKQQWEAQRLFQKEHTEAEDGLRRKLVDLYKQEAALSSLRERLRGPEIFLATQDEQDELLDTIAEKLKELRKQVDEIASDGLMSSVANDEEAKLRLLLWDAKATLFVQAVHIQAERRPIALQNRSPAVKKVINSYNRCYLNYIKKFPNERLGDAEDYPLTYENFVRFPIDHRFWNDGLYYHSKAPWATDPDTIMSIWAMMDKWNKKIGWLWDRCQPDSSRTYKLDWDEMMDHIQRGSPIDPAVFEGVNELREETVLDIDLDDGEDAEGDWIDEMETPHVDQHADANDSKDPEDY